MDIVLPDISRLGYDARKHAYTLDGTKLLSGVTTVLSATSDKAQLINWSANMAVDYLIAASENRILLPEDFTDARTAHTRKKEAAGEHGTDVHALVERYILGCIATNSGVPVATILSPIQPFVDWAQGEVAMFVAAEQKLYDEDNAAAGTADFFYFAKNGDFVVGDLKTFPKMWSPDAYCQTGMYARMWRLLTGLQPARSTIVKMCDPEDPRIKKYGGKPFAVYNRGALEEDEAMFLNRLAVYRYNKNFTSPKE